MQGIRNLKRNRDRSFDIISNNPQKQAIDAVTKPLSEEELFELEVQKEMAKMQKELTAPPAGIQRVKKRGYNPLTGATLTESKDESPQRQQYSQIGAEVPVRTKLAAVEPPRVKQPYMKQFNAGFENKENSGSMNVQYVQALESRIQYLERENVNLLSRFERYKTDVSSRFADNEKRVEEKVFSEIQKRWNQLMEKEESRFGFGGGARRRGGNNFNRNTNFLNSNEQQQSSESNTGDTNEASMRNEISLLKAGMGELRQQLVEVKGLAANVANLSSIAGAETDPVTMANFEDLAKELDRDLLKIKTELNKREDVESEYKTKERRKGAVLFGEMVRLGEALEASSLKAARALSILEQRIREAEAQHEKFQMSVAELDTRSASRFNMMQQRAQSLEERNAKLEESLLAQKAALHAENLDRSRLEEEQKKWTTELRNTLIRSDVKISEKLSSSIMAISEKIVEVRRETMDNLSRIRAEIRLKDQAAEQKKVETQQEMLMRFNAIEGQIRNEIEAREEGDQSIIRDEESRWQLVMQEISAEQKARAEGDEQLTIDLSSNVKELSRIASEQFKESKEEIERAEGVLRAEVKARLRRDKAMKEGLAKTTKSLGDALENLRVTHNKDIDKLTMARLKDRQEVNDNVIKITSDLDSTIKSIDTKQSLSNAEITSRIQTLEEREDSTETEMKSALLKVTKKVEKFAAANADAVSALQMVVQSDRRTNDAKIAEVKALTAADIEVLGVNVQEMISQYAVDNQQEIKKYRDERTHAIKSLREIVRTNKHAINDRVNVTVENLNDAARTRAVKSVLDQCIGKVVEEDHRERIKKVKDDMLKLVRASMKRTDRLGDRLDKQREYDSEEALKRYGRLNTRIDKRKEETTKVKSSVATEKAQRCRDDLILQKSVTTNVTNLYAYVQEAFKLAYSDRKQHQVRTALDALIDQVADAELKDIRKSDVEWVKSLDKAQKRSIEELREAIGVERAVGIELRRSIGDIVSAAEREKLEADRHWKQSQLLAKQFIQDEIEATQLDGKGQATDPGYGDVEVEGEEQEFWDQFGPITHKVDFK